MWIVNFLPTWIFYLITIAGIAGFLASYVLTMIPFVGSNAIGVRVGSVLAIVIGVWFCGAAYNNSAWEARVKEMEAKVAAAEAESNNQNKAIDGKVVTKVQIVRERGQTITRYIDREVSKYDGQCVIPKEFVEAHNKAAEQPK